MYFIPRGWVVVGGVGAESKEIWIRLVKAPATWQTIIIVFADGPMVEELREEEHCFTYGFIR